MAVTADDLFEWARDTCEGNTEVEHRAAASRAYYAAFHACRPTAVALGLQTHPQKGTHNDLVGILTAQHSNLKHLAVGHALENARRLRVRADYRIEEDFSHNQAATCIEHCQTVFRKLEELQDPETPAHGTSA